MDPQNLQIGQVGVRMYKVGFGDCFLVFVATDQGIKKLLVDCGSMKKHEKSISEIVPRVIEHVTGPDGPSIDVVIATHRHRDHISGFGREGWAQVEVGEVWMPWTEDPGDSTARGVQRAQTGFAERLVESLSRTAFSFAGGGQLAAAVGADADEDDMAGLLELEGVDPRSGLAMWMALNARGNQAALDTLREGFAGQPRRFFLPARDDADPRHRSFETELVPGARFHLLGPPLEEDRLGRMEGQGESYFQLALGGGDNGGASPQEPFSPVFRRAAKDIPDHLLSTEMIDVLKIRDIDEELLLAALNDYAINNTSLIFVLEVGRTRLLFSGDAQWGPWEAAMEDPEWADLLDTVDFYKVGHHASHNATPKSLVKDHFRAGPSGLISMISVAKHGSFDDIPRPPLVTALTKLPDAKLVRSDTDAAIAAPFEDGEDWIDVVV